MIENLFQIDKKHTFSYNSKIAKIFHFFIHKSKDIAFLASLFF
jgi:hypothetical protein